MAVATKDEEMETGAGEDDAKVGLLQDQMSDAAVTENFLGGPALSVDTVFHFPQNPTECMWHCIFLLFPVYLCHSILS